MTDYAKLVIEADTSDLKGAVQDLNRLEEAARGMSREASIANVTNKKNLVELAKNNVGLANSLNKQLILTKQATQEQKAYARSVLDLAKNKLILEQQNLQEAMSIDKIIVNQERLARLQKLSVVRNNSGGFSGSAANAAATGTARDMAPNRFNTGNIAAQFQDIGVTAAMGMNPLTIAIQQGTQLSAVLQTMENPLTGIAAAFRQIVSPVALLSIGLTALAVVGIQMTDWVKLGQTVLNGLADVLVESTPLVAALGTTMLVAFSPSILVAIGNITTSVITLGTSALVAGASFARAWVLANPLTALAGILTAITVFSANAFEPVRDLVNKVIGAFVKAGIFSLAAVNKLALDVIKNFEGMANGVINVANDLLSKLPEFMGGSNAAIGRADFSGLYSGFENNINAMNELLASNQNVDYFGNIQNGISNLTGMAADKLRGFSGELGKLKAEQDAKKIEDPYGDIIKGAEKRVESLRIEQMTIGKTTLEAVRMRTESDLLLQAKDKELKLTKAQAAEISNLAAETAKYEDANKRLLESYNFDKDVKNRLQDLADERAAIGQTTLEITRMRLERQLLNQIEDPTLLQSSNIKAIAADMARLTEENRKLTESYEFGTGTIKGFFVDLKDNLKQGEGLWQSFANAATKAIDSIGDKLFDLAAQDLATGLYNSTGIGGLFQSAFGGAAESLTNTVTDTPQLFKFAKGGKFGVMGESGAEAVLPLQRGSDGSLGVRLNGSESGKRDSGGNTVVNVYNNSNAKSEVTQTQTANGLQIDVVIDDMIAQKVAKQGSSTNRALSSNSNRALIRR